jgi:hypothetical protein
MDIGIIIIFHIVSLFFISGIAKLTSLKKFIQYVEAFDVLPRRIAIAFGVFVPFLELSGAVFLLMEHTRVYGAAILGFLLMTFIYAIIHALRAGEQISCGCYGRLFDAKVSSFTLGKAAYLFVLIIILTIYSSLFTGEHSASYVVMGVFLTLILLVTEKIWYVHAQTLEHLRNLK